MNPTLALHNAVAAVAPIVGVQMGSIADRSTWRVDFSPEATVEQRGAAASVLATFDPTAPTPDAARETQFLGDADRIDIMSRLTSATPAQIKSYVDSSVTNLASTKTLLAKVMLVLAVMAKR